MSASLQVFSNWRIKNISVTIQLWTLWSNEEIQKGNITSAPCMSDSVLISSAHKQYRQERLASSVPSGVMDYVNTRGPSTESC